ncbi:hypothetical protein [Hymenobacter properus]|uniref:DUF1460 domain-containing protein n=1 Tax=Hymenobacter properus TaxID=2791026 RepID=A0A931FGZ1_9BACT|nr:hypothetical protein [Hymenobacter properus]MBF9140487.1 hypothetical protein [Hymenobacter properus]MBR7719294.1 hypothetical protein [Microvirga sp. SRT04]
MKSSVLALLLLAGLRGCFAQNVASDSTSGKTKKAAAEHFSAPAYHATLRRFTARRLRLAARYRQAATRPARAARLAEARELLLTALDSTIFPAWEGTPWAFYGTSWEPRRGRIACGYFVTTSLHDAGLRLQRTVLAKQTSECIIKNLTSEAHITRYWGVESADFVQQVRALGPGLYVLGLDFHVAFLRVREGGAVQMVHSSYLGPGTVVREAAESSAAIGSKYRVLGKVSDDDAFVRRWLLGEALAVHGATVKE